MIFRVLRWLNIFTVSLLGWISTSIKSIFCPPWSWTKLSLPKSFFVNLTCSWLNAPLDASWDEFDAFKLLPFKLGKLGLLCLISIRYFHVWRRLFLTSAAEKTKTQAQNSSQKLKEKNQPQRGTFFRSRKTQGKNSILRIFLKKLKGLHLLCYFYYQIFSKSVHFEWKLKFCTEF